jgi:glycosyltransferase involved in cell wall biosynthesis
MANSNTRDRPYIPAVRAAAVEEFAATVGPDFLWAPVVALIAAYDEEQSIGSVIEAIARQACGLEVDVLIVDDGSTDGTFDVVSKYDGVRCVRLARNCGHGVALRLGYQLCRDYGAEMIVTLDGDMQWDPAEIPTVLAPLAADEADFVLGSRVLGASETDDSLRSVGVTVFARLVSLLTGQHVTDTSTGFRAMRAELTEVVPQQQVQYQTSELLIGAIYAGYRIAERPITMHKRLAGESKKGRNVFYGGRYARVILGTWWRERSRARRAGRLTAR